MKTIVITAIVTALLATLIVYLIMRNTSNDGKLSQASTNTNQNISTQKPSETPTILPTTAVTIKPTQDPYQGWKTYTNDKYKYSFKYPSTMDVGYLSVNNSPDYSFIKLCSIECAKSVKSGIGNQLFQGLIISAGSNFSIPVSRSDLIVKKLPSTIVGGKSADVYSATFTQDAPESGGIGNTTVYKYIKSNNMTYAMIYDNNINNLNPYLNESKQAIDSFVCL